MLATKIFLLSQYLGKKVSLRLCQQIDMPNHCNKKQVIFLCFYGLLLPAMPIRWSSASSGSPSWVHVVCHTTCSSCSLLSWQLLVSFIPPCSLLPSFPSISFHSQALLLLSLNGVYSNPPGYTQKHTYSFAIPRFISLHFRSTTSFIHFSRI